MNPKTKNIFAPLASLRLTVILLGLAMILIFAGTTVQTEMSVWDVQRRFFHSWFCFLEWRSFFPLWGWGSKHIPGAIPFPGGFTLIVLLLVNLLAAHSLRFKLSWKRSGILLIHAGLILLIVGEVVTAESAREGQMSIDVGGSSNFTSDIRQAELAIVDPSPAGNDDEIVVPVARLSQTGTIQHPKLPFSLHIDEFARNSYVKGPMEPGAKHALATVGSGVGITLVPQPKFTGTEASSVDLPSAFVTLTSSGGESLGTYLLSTIPLDPPFKSLDAPQSVKVGGKEYWLQLRFKREYKPYTIHLAKFSHDIYQGTNVPKNFSSQIRLIDPTHNVDRDVLIWMNHPLRYGGETFYQSSFKPGDQTSILQVVRNPGWLIPYVSCSMVALGLLIHFGMHLIGFLSRAQVPVRAAGDGGSGQRSGATTEPVPAKRNGKHGTAVLDRPQVAKRSAPVLLGRAERSSPMVAVAVTGICLLVLIASIMPGRQSGAYDMDLFARVPVSFEGRTMPLDSLARNSLRIISGRSQFTNGAVTVPASMWMLDVLTKPDSAATYKVFRIDHPDIKSMLGLDDSEKLFSFDQIDKSMDKLQQQYSMAQNVLPKSRDLYQRKIIELGGHLMLFYHLADTRTLLLSPPLVENEWRSLETASQAGRDIAQHDPGAAAFLAIVQARHDAQPIDFQTAGASYRDLLDKQMPDLSRKLDLEVFFNNAEPFYRCMILYAVAFVLAACSWLKWQGPLSRAAYWVVVLAFVVHTLGLVARIYLQGRPPVTNLYSSAIFIAWVVAAFCVGMELLFRNGVATAAASAVAFPSLLIAHFLAGDGDTMKMLEAVLDTNIWLATHVVVVTMGYAATFLAGMLAAGYVLVNAIKGLETETRKTLYRMVYGVVCFAMLFSFVGTILGGIWADQSWGRFWGWDPKENGAVLIVLWNAIVLHARWGGLVKERGFMNLVVFGNVVTSWSWFGTNMLGVGLHSYGFMDSALAWLLTWVGLQLAIIGIGLMHPKYLGGLRDPRGFEVKPS